MNMSQLYKILYTYISYLFYISFQKKELWKRFYKITLTIIYEYTREITFEKIFYGDLQGLYL